MIRSFRSFRSLNDERIINITTITLDKDPILSYDSRSLNDERIINITTIV